MVSGPGAHPPTAGSYDMGYGLDSIEELSLPSFDEGEPVDPDALTDPFGPGTRTEEIPAPDESTKLPETPKLPPAPGGPEPPGKDDLEIPQIVPGELIPPPVSEEDEVKPPGQIKLPDSVQHGAGLPDELRIHPALSGGQRIDGEIDSMTIVVNVTKIGAHREPGRMRPVVVC